MITRVDAFFSRIERVIKTLLSPEPKWDRKLNESLYSEAWEELEEYLRTGEKGPRTDSGENNKGSRSPGNSKNPQAAAQDYRNLELEPGSDFTVVKQSYRRLMRTYHPDKYAHDPERQRIATEISARINTSFNRIREATES